MSGFLLDTNIPSELIRIRPEPQLVDWLEAQEDDTLFLSVVTIGEIRKGFVVLPDSKRRTHLEQWLEHDLLPWFVGRILPVTQTIADRWGVVDGRRQLQGAPLNIADGMIAATALEHDLTLVTRNTRDFDGLELRIFNPWEPR